MSKPATQTRLAVPAHLRGLRWPRVTVPALVRREPLIVALALAGAGVYAIYGLWAHEHFQTEYDLSIFDQVVWRWSHFQLPIGTIAFSTSENELADHFSPILALLAPLYWIWSDARMLLIAQGALLGASVVPLFLYARPRIGRVGAYLLAAGYLLFWGISAGVGYQFHELAFAPLLIGLTIYFADQERWRGFWIAAALLLLVKENMSVLVVFIGLWLLTRGQYRRGLIAVGVGLAWYFLVVEVFMPALTPAGHEYTHWTYTAFGPNLTSALGNVVRYPGLLFHELINDPLKVRTLAYLVVPFLALMLYSPLVLLCVPLVAEEMFSSDPLFWGTRFHHWLPIGVVLAMGAADGLRNLLRLTRREYATAWIGAAAGALILIANFEIAKRFPLSRIMQPNFTFTRTPVDRAMYHAIGKVPAGASVTTQAPVLPHLSQRAHVYLLGRCPTSPATRYLVINLPQAAWPDPVIARKWVEVRRSQYDQIFGELGWTVLRRKLGVSETSGLPGNRTVC
jgi:uncharacterized membrane protein